MFNTLWCFAIIIFTLQNGVDINCVDRVLLHSAKPTLLANVNCTPLVSAVVSHQASIVKYLLEVMGFLIC